MARLAAGMCVSASGSIGPCVNEKDPMEMTMGGLASASSYVQSRISGGAGGGGFGRTRARGGGGARSGGPKAIKPRFTQAQQIGIGIGASILGPLALSETAKGAYYGGKGVIEGVRSRVAGKGFKRGYAKGAKGYTDSSLIARGVKGVGNFVGSRAKAAGKAYRKSMYRSMNPNAVPMTRAERRALGVGRELQDLQSNAPSSVPTRVPAKPSKAKAVMRGVKAAVKAASYFVPGGGVVRRSQKRRARRQRKRAAKAT